MVTTSSFLHAPVSRTLLFGLLASSLLTSVLDLKPYAPIKPIPHLWPYLQLWRILTFQFCHVSSVELLFASALIYNFRTLERVWGSRKYASFLIASWIVSGTFVVALGIALKLLTLGRWGYIPPGMTSVVFAVLSVWRGEIPNLSSVKLVTSEGKRGEEPGGVLLSDKFTMYIMAAQLGLSQFPYSLVPAGVGWVVGTAWREEALPMGLMRWRIPGWLVGDAGSAKGPGRQYEGLRRRLEEEGGNANDGMREVSDGVVRGAGRQQQQDERRGWMRTLGGYFGGGTS